jgi:hypothetical protein
MEAKFVKVNAVLSNGQKQLSFINTARITCVVSEGKNTSKVHFDLGALLVEGNPDQLVGRMREASDRAETALDEAPPLVG